MIRRRVVANAAIPDFGELRHIIWCEDSPLKQQVLQLREPIRVRVFSDRRSLVVGLERLENIIFLVDEINNERALLAGGDSI